MDKSDVEMKDATEQSQGPQSEELNPQNGSVDVPPLENDEKLACSATGEDTEAGEVGTQENVEGVTEAKDEVDAGKNTESEVENPKSKEMENELEMPAENVDRDAQLGERTEEDQKIKENSEVEKTTIENGTGVGEKKDEPSEDEVLKSENEGMVNEPKQPEKMVAPTSSLEDGDAKKSEVPEAERDCTDADQGSTEAMVDAPKDPAKGDVPATAAADTNASLGTSLDNQNPTTPLSMIKCPSTKSGGQSVESYRNMFNEVKIPGDDDGTPEEQAAFMKELESFYREKSIEFKAPKFYGQQLNCLKLWRLVIRLGGYDRVTGSKLWRQVGESFHPPKTCTTVSWTFRIFYEKALQEYEKHVIESGELQLPLFAGSDPSSVDNEDKNGNIMPRREKSIKSIGSLKQKRPDEVEHPVKAARSEQSKQLVTSVADAGPPADWVRINVRETKDCYEVYALVPGLLREEVRIQSDPAGRLVITGQPDQPDNPWGITAFKKVVSLPGRIDPQQTSAVVSLHGRLFVRVPFEQ